MKPIVIALCALVGIGAISWALFEHKRCERYVSHFVEYEFDIARDITITRWKSSGNLASIGYDLNEDMVDDSIVVYGPSGKAVSTWVDENFNGNEEVQYLYSPEEVLIARYEDREEDGHVEEYIRYSTDSLFVFRDKDQNGYYAPFEIIRAAAIE